VLLYGSETWTIKVRDARRITAAEINYMRRTAGYIWTDYKTNGQIAKELKLTPILDKLLEYKKNWIQHVNRMPRNRLPRVMIHYSPTGRRNHGRSLKRLLDTWDRNGSTSGPTPWHLYDDDELQKRRIANLRFALKVKHFLPWRLSHSDGPLCWKPFDSGKGTGC